MKSIDQIKNEVAKESNYRSWFSVEPELEGIFIDKIAERYSEERLKEFKLKLKLSVNMERTNYDYFIKLIDSL